MTYFTTTLTTAASSSPGASTVCNLNWIGGKPTTVVVYSTVATSSTFFQIQYTLDDPTKVGGSSLAYWQGLSSGFLDTGVSYGAASVFSTSSITSPDGLIFSFLSPVAAVRLNSSAMTSGPLTMKVIQGEGW